MRRGKGGEKMQKVRAKFKVNAKEQTMSGTEVMTTIKMNPVYSGSEENKNFYKYTPSGELRLGVLKDEVGKFFELDKEYYVEFTPAEG